MAIFKNFIPESGQTDVARTTIVKFAIEDEYGTAHIDSLNVSINDTYAVYEGSFINGYSGSIFVSIDGYLVGIYPKSPFLNNASEISIHIEILDNAELDSYDYVFYTSGFQPDPPEPLPPIYNRACNRVVPFFPPTNLGLKLAADNGTGTEINLTWEAAYPFESGDTVFYNIYYAATKDVVFDGYPDFLVTDTRATIWGINPGKTYYFGVRVSEFETGTFTYYGMQQAGPDMFFYPSFVKTTEIISDIATTVPVTSTDGFPNYGIILIDAELIRYSSIQVYPPAFIVSERGFSDTIESSHSINSDVSLYFGQEDSNTITASSVPTFQKPNYALTYVLGDGYGPDGYRDGYDGYAQHDGYLRFKQETIDSVTSPGTQNDESGTFPRFDYCGTWRSMSPQSFMQGQCQPSYFGGVQIRTDQDGNRHLVKASNVQTHMLQREEMLLESTGEPFVLVRRMWTGMRCHCFMLRREHPDSRCPTCFGTGFVQGYVQFFNPRRSDRRVLVRVDPATDDLSIIDRGGFEPVYEPDAWTLPFPQIKDRDILVRFIEDTLEEWRYEVLNVTRNKVMFTQTGAQKFKLKRLPKDDEIYQFPIIRNTAPMPGTIWTSENSTPGISAHSHGIVVPDGVSLLTLKVATLEAQGHNHIIYNGVVQPVLNHTHIIVL